MTSKRVALVGGVAGGASAAARARRLGEQCELVAFERGAHVSFANRGSLGQHPARPRAGSDVGQQSQPHRLVSCRAVRMNSSSGDTILT